MKIPGPRLLRAVCLGFILWGIGCTWSARPPRVPDPAMQASLDDLLHYFVYAQSLSSDILQQEYRQKNQAFLLQPTAESRLKLAFLLSIPGTPFFDLARAQGMLQEYLSVPEEPPTPLRHLTSLVFTTVASRTQEYNAKHLHKKLQEALHEQEAQVSAAQQLTKKLQEDLRTQTLTCDTLQKKLQDVVSEKETQTTTSQQLTKKLQEDLRTQTLTCEALQKKLQDVIHEKEEQVALSQRLNRQLADEKYKLQETIEKIKNIEKSLIERDKTDHKGT